MVDADGTITATSTGGTVTATDSADRVLGSGRSIPQGSNSAWADRFDLVANNTRSDGSRVVGARATVESSINSNIPGSLRGKHATISHTHVHGSTANVIVSHDETGQLQFNVSIYDRSPIGPTGVIPEIYPYRYINTYEPSQDIESVTRTRRTITNHGMGAEWQVEELIHDYQAGGTLSVYVATDVQQSDMARDRTASVTNTGDEVVFSGGYDVPPGYDAIQFLVPGDRSLSGTLDAHQGQIHCPTGFECVFIKDHTSEGFYTTTSGPYLSSLQFVQPGQQPTREYVEPRNYGGTTAADYLAFGNWLYVPDDTTQQLEYDFGVFASGGDPFQVRHIEALAGTAIYEGDATGIYYVDKLGTNPIIGSFIAEVMLTAEFGTDSEIGRLSGEVSNFVFDGDVSSSLPATIALTSNVPDWIAEDSYTGVVQGETNIFGNARNQIQNLMEIYGQSGGWIEGLTSANLVGESWQGRWNAKFYGNGASPTDYPTSVAGVFGSSNNSSGLSGSFGAHRQ